MNDTQPFGACEACGTPFKDRAERYHSGVMIAGSGKNACSHCKPLLEAANRLCAANGPKEPEE